MQYFTKSKAFFRSVLPANLVSYWQGCRLRGFQWHTLCCLKQPKIKTEFAMNNQGLPANRIAIRKGLEFSILSGHRFDFEAYSVLDYETYHELETLLRLGHDEKLKILYDVGAEAGVFSLAFCKGHTGRHAFAFEPSPVGLEDLRQHVLMNDLSDQVHIVGKAAGEDNRTISFTMRGPQAEISSGPVSNDVEAESKAEMIKQLLHQVTTKRYTSSRRLNPCFPNAILTWSTLSWMVAAPTGASRSSESMKPKLHTGKVLLMEARVRC